MNSLREESFKSLHACAVVSTLMLVGRCRPPSTRLVGAGSSSSRAALLPDSR